MNSCLFFLSVLTSLLSATIQNRELDDIIEKYLTAIERENRTVKCEEADFLIETCEDSATRSFTASKVYDYYASSKVMGDEAVAIHVFDKWFLSGQTKMRNENDFVIAKMFADFNRQSLIGCKAPPLSMQDTSGTYFTLFENNGNTVDKENDIVGIDRVGGKVSVLYFYDTECITCVTSSAALNRAFLETEYPITFYAIYTGSDYQKWKKYIRTGLNLNDNKNNFVERSGKMDVIHLWDPEVSSDYQVKYGILSTPRIFVVDKDGIIIGRGLDPVSLMELLKIYFSREKDKACIFGSAESKSLYDGIFSIYGKDLTCEAVDSIRTWISDKSMEGGDTLLFRQMIGDLMYYLAGKRGNVAKCALKNLIDSDVNGKKEDVWSKSPDSLTILPYSEMINDLIMRSPAGTTLPKIKVPGELVHKGKKHNMSYFELHGIRNVTIVFHTPDCSSCRAELEAIDSLSKEDRKLKFLLVNVDDILAYSPEKAKILFDSFDFTLMPYILSTDGRGMVKERYISFDPMIFYR